MVNGGGGNGNRGDGYDRGEAEFLMSPKSS